MSQVVAITKGVLASILLGMNTLIFFSAMMPFALVKLALRHPAVRRPMDRALNGLAQGWVGMNGVWIAMMQKIDWRISGVDALQRGRWYLVSSNHQTWVDILVLQKVFDRRIPFLKFFLKRELMYVPVMGLAWWALDFPFMRRSGGGRDFAKDLAATKQSCERFRLIPTSVINFLEGTRRTPAKHAAQQSPYRHLLKPKVGGLAMALAVMGQQFNSYLDVTIVYPAGVPTFWDLLCGRVRSIVVDVREVPIPSSLATGNYANDSGYRRELQTWVQEMWEEKDRLIEVRLSAQ
jgi:1-acyl-sn-glycerol-3-phosphate acyltransferase